MKPMIHAAALAMVVAAGAQYTIVDAQGRIVGSLATDTPLTQLRVIGTTQAGHTVAAAQPDPRADRIQRQIERRVLMPALTGDGGG